MKIPLFLSILSAGLGGWLSGCSSASSSTPVYSQAEIGQAIDQQKGEIISARDVIITPNSTARSGAAGTGSRVGAASVLGAITGSPQAVVNVVGSVVGESGGKKFDNKAGEEITVRTKDGHVTTVVQERGTIPFVPGDSVVVMTSGSSPYSQQVRVVHDTTTVTADAPIGARTR